MIQTDAATGERRIITDTEKENLLLRNLAQIDRMVGASKAEQSNNNAAAALAKLLGVPVEELPGNDDEPES